MVLPDVDRRLREIIASIHPTFLRAMLAVLEAADGDDRARAIGDLYATGFTPATVELLIDAKEDKYLRAVLVGMLREADR